MNVGWGLLTGWVVLYFGKYGTVLMLNILFQVLPLYVTHKDLEKQRSNDMTWILFTSNCARIESITKPLPMVPIQPQSIN